MLFLYNQCSMQAVALAEQLATYQATRASLDMIQREYAEYKARASRILQVTCYTATCSIQTPPQTQAKEKIITEMKTGDGRTTADAAGHSSAEYELLRSELEEARMQIEQLRADVQVLLSAYCVLTSFTPHRKWSGISKSTPRWPRLNSKSLNARFCLRETPD